MELPNSNPNGEEPGFPYMLVTFLVLMLLLGLGLSLLEQHSSDNN